MDIISKPLCFQCVSSCKPCKYRDYYGSCTGCNWFLSCASCNFSDYDSESGSFECLLHYSIPKEC